jgi:hypothetical protein
MFGHCKGFDHEERPSLAEIGYRCLSRTAARLAVAAPVPDTAAGDETCAHPTQASCHCGALISRSDQLRKTWAGQWPALLLLAR